MEEAAEIASEPGLDPMGLASPWVVGFGGERSGSGHVRAIGGIFGVDGKALTEEGRRAEERSGNALGARPSGGMELEQVSPAGSRC
jgi:hypothetical protein